MNAEIAGHLPDVVDGVRLVNVQSGIDHDFGVRWDSNFVKMREVLKITYQQMRNCITIKLPFVPSLFHCIVYCIYNIVYCIVYRMEHQSQWVKSKIHEQHWIIYNQRQNLKENAADEKQKEGRNSSFNDLHQETDTSSF